MKILRLLHILTILCTMSEQIYAAPEDQETTIAFQNNISACASLFEKDPHDHVITWGIWGSGWNHKDSHLPMEQLPQVKIGGEEDAPHFFPAVEQFLKYMPEKYCYGLMLDDTTHRTNSSNIQDLKKKFGERFIIVSIKEVCSKIKNDFQKHADLLDLIEANASGGAAVLTSDMLRLIGMPYAHPYQNKNLQHCYADIDEFVFYMKEGQKKSGSYSVTRYEYSFLKYILSSGPKDFSKSEDEPFVGFYPSQVTSYYGGKTNLSYPSSETAPAAWTNAYIKIEEKENLRSRLSDYTNDVLDFASSPERNSYKSLEIHKTSYRDFCEGKSALEFNRSFHRNTLVVDATGPGFLKDLAKKTNQKKYWYMDFSLRYESYDDIETRSRSTWSPKNPSSSENYFEDYSKKMWGNKGLEKKKFLLYTLRNPLKKKQKNF